MDDLVAEPTQDIANDSETETSVAETQRSGRAARTARATEFAPLGVPSSRAKTPILSARSTECRESGADGATSSAKPMECSPRRQHSRKGSGRGQFGRETHRTPAAPAAEFDGQPSDETHYGAAVEDDGGGHRMDETHVMSAPAIVEIQQAYRQRVRWLKARNALILQAKAYCRAICMSDKEAGTQLFDEVKAGRGEMRDTIALGPFIRSIATFDADLAEVDKLLAKKAKALPVHAWTKSVKGFGDLSLAQLVGEAGDIGSYKSPSALWKRMGLAVIDGVRQRRVADAELALVHGYSPERRAVVWNIGNWLAMAQTRSAKGEDGKKIKGAESLPNGPFGAWMIEEKRRQMVKCEAIAADPEQVKKFTRTAEKYSPKAHAHNRAQRHMTKQLLLHFYLAWKGIERRDHAAE